MYLATWADPDGTDAFPGLKLTATDCGLTVRGLSNVLDWLAQHALIAVEYKASHLGTNRYAVLLTDEALKIAHEKIENDAAEVTIRAKAERARQARSKAAKSRWAKKRASADVERSVLGDIERSVLGDVERSVLGAPGTGCIGHGTECIGRGTLRSTDRPINRPLDRERDPAKASLPPKDAAIAAQGKNSLEADCEWIAIRIAKNRWTTTPRTEGMVRGYLKEGRSKEKILEAIKSTMSAKPEGDRQPGLYLAQNLEAHMNLLIAESRGEVIATMAAAPGRTCPQLPWSDR
jgi:hypothetical protein